MKRSRYLRWPPAKCCASIPKWLLSKLRGGSMMHALTCNRRPGARSSFCQVQPQITCNSHDTSSCMQCTICLCTFVAVYHGSTCSRRTVLHVLPSRHVSLYSITDCSSSTAGARSACRWQCKGGCRLRLQVQRRPGSRLFHQRSCAQQHGHRRAGCARPEARCVSVLRIARGSATR